MSARNARECILEVHGNIRLLSTPGMRAENNDAGQTETF